jgi:sterol desaturase/sphingolipid hydroxylase (fatty acid hydroxylase superfamily)
LIGAVAAGLAGVASWSVAEHFIHHYLGHRYAKNRNPFAREHVRHHATTSYFAPNYKKAIAAGVTAVAVAPVAIALTGPTLGAAYTLGLVSMYVGYEVLHRRAHTHPPRSRYGRWLRKHHFHHHFHDPAVNHGVTSPLWDHLLGTFVRPGVIKVPAKHAMTWLVDATTGQIHPEYRDDYELVHKRATAASVTTAA